MIEPKKKIIIALCILCAVIAVFGVSRYYGNKKDTVEGDNNKKIIDAENIEVKKYSVKQSDKSVVFVKEGTNWIIEGNENADLIQISIDQAIAYLKSLEYTHIIQNGIENAADYGIDNGIINEISDDSGNIISVVVGNKTVDNTGYYANAGGKDVYIISADAGKALSHSPDEFRDKYPAYVDYSDIRTLDVKKDDGTIYSIVPNPKGEFTSGYGEYILSGYYSFDIPVITEKLADNIGGKFYEITAQDFIDKPDPSIDYGFDKPLITVSAYDNSGRECTITVGNLCDDDTSKYYAKFSGKDYICTVLKDKVESIYNTNPFDIIGKYYINEGIESFSEILISDNTFTATYNINADDKSITLNGQTADTLAFEEIYKSIAAITMDGEIKKELGEFVGEIILTNINGSSIKLDFFEYDDNYYAVEKNGTAEFITGKRNILQITEAVKALM